MPKLYFGDKGGLYFIRNKKKKYIKLNQTSFGVQEFYYNKMYHYINPETCEIVEYEIPQEDPFGKINITECNDGGDDTLDILNHCNNKSFYFVKLLSTITVDNTPTLILIL